MNKKLQHAGIYLALTAAFGGYSSAALACSSEDYLSTVCIMAVSATNYRGLAPANGAVLAINTNQALFSLIGTTYGGNGSTTFALPDLRGRFVIGAGAAAYGTTYSVGQTGGANQVTLTTANLPAHTHTLANLGLTGLSATVDLSKVTASANLSGVTFSASGSSLTLRGYNGNGNANNPSGGALANPFGPASKIYASSAPNVDMMAGSISGSISGTLSGTAPVTLSGSAPVSVSGTVNGNTGVTGSSQPFQNLPPYLAMNYFIVTQGLYPSQN
jgi:microcystin-dependent protein